MRIAVISDVHGNRTALEAVIRDLGDVAPDLTLDGGDLADGSPGGPDVVDRIRGLGWPGVVGNTDEMLFRPESLAEFAGAVPQMAAMFAAIGEMAAASRELLGEERLNWLRGLARYQTHGPVALVHASPDDLWRAPGPDAPDAELEATFVPLVRAVAVYGHIHRPFVRTIAGLTVANSGSVGLPYDGDNRASYLLVDDGHPAIRRVEYNVDKERKTVLESGFPHAGWVAAMLASGSFQPLPA